LLEAQAPVGVKPQKVIELGDSQWSKVPYGVKPQKVIELGDSQWAKAP
jgi:hypothetical protein